MLAHPDLLPEKVSRAEVVTLGWQWLAGREDHPGWNRVWQAVLAHPDPLPEKVSRAEVVTLGWQWLAGREDRSEWSYVWQAVMAHADLLPREASADLVALGWHWLAGREDRQDWSYVWQAVLAQPDLPGDVSKPDLVALGCHWLAGRENQQDWSHVWQTALALPDLLPEKVTETDLVALGWEWLKAYPTAQDWPVVWWELAHRLDPADEKRPEIIRLGLIWLRQDGHLSTPAASRIVETLIDMDCRDPRFLALASDWLHMAVQHRFWPIIAAKFIAHAPSEPAATRCATELTRRVSACPNGIDWRRVEPQIQTLRAMGGAAVPEVVALLAAIDGRSSAPAWTRAAQLIQSGEPVSAQVVGAKSNVYFVELDIGLIARLVRYGMPRLTDGVQLDVWVTAVNPSKGFVGVTTANASGVNPAATISVGSEYGGVVSGAQDYGLFMHIHGRQGLIHSNKFPPGENFYARHPVGSVMTVRVISITERGLELEPVFAAAAGGDTRIEAASGGTDNEAVRYALDELRKRSRDEALSDDDMAWIAEQCSQPQILENTEVLFRFPPFNADTFRRSAGQRLLSALIDVLTYHVSRPDLIQHIVRHISRLFAFLCASLEPSFPIPEYPRIRKVLMLWIRNPVSFLEPIPSEKAPIHRLVEEIGLLIATGALDLEADRDNLMRFFAWTSRCTADKRPMVEEALQRFCRESPDKAALWDSWRAALDGGRNRGG